VKKAQTRKNRQERTEKKKQSRKNREERTVEVSAVPEAAASHPLISLRTQAKCSIGLVEAPLSSEIGLIGKAA